MNDVVVLSYRISIPLTGLNVCSVGCCLLLLSTTTVFVLYDDNKGLIDNRGNSNVKVGKNTWLHSFLLFLDPALIMSIHTHHTHILTSVHLWWSSPFIYKEWAAC